MEQVKNEKLMEDAPSTINYYLRNVIEDLDNRWGEGYAEKHPELVGALVYSCTLDYQANIQQKAISELNTKIEEGADQLACVFEILSKKL